jgi:hypothetical protein
MLTNIISVDAFMTSMAESTLSKRKNGQNLERLRQPNGRDRVKTALIQ